MFQRELILEGSEKSRKAIYMEDHMKALGQTDRLNKSKKKEGGKPFFVLLPRKINGHLYQAPDIKLDLKETFLSNAKLKVYIPTSKKKYQFY